MSNRKTLIASAIALACSASVMADRLGSTNFGAGDRSALHKKYTDFRTIQISSGSPSIAVIQIGMVKGLSKSFNGTAGTITLDLRSGVFAAEFSGLVPGETYTLWLVDQSQGSPVGDLSTARSFRLGQLGGTGPAAALSGSLDSSLLSGFEIDRVVLSRTGGSISDVVASGSLGVLQKMFFRSPEAAKAGAGLPFARLVPSLVPNVTAGDGNTAGQNTRRSSSATTSAAALEALIEQGARLFFDETFAGNGRTCGTCHPASRNFTIDPEFISKLPPDDPLFVAEFNPALAQLERPALMRKFGLILENVDGLDNPTQKYTMRSVPHTLGMQVSLTTDASRANPPAAMTGWSGDGAPGAGSLRDFAIGAVTQHFTKTLGRSAGQDFVLPTEQQLDALEAFQLSLGRAADFDLAKVTFLDAGVATGQALFVNGSGDPLAGGRCGGCHVNGGALAANGQNRNFNTNVEDAIHPARSIEDFPRDGGFGQTLNATGAFGDGTFNSTSVVEAADTPPFFHNNLVNTLEEVVGFYSGPVFNASRDARGRFNFTTAQITHIANFMRGLNTLQNIDLARTALTQALALNVERHQSSQRLAASLADIGDAIKVLSEGGIFPAAKEQLTEAQRLLEQCGTTHEAAAHAARIEQAIAALNSARTLVATIAP